MIAILSKPTPLSAEWGAPYRDRVFHSKSEERSPFERFWHPFVDDLDVPNTHGAFELSRPVMDVLRRTLVRTH